MPSRSACSLASTVLVTSMLRPDRPEDTIEMLAVTDDGAWSVRTPRLPMKVNGSGDLTSALFTAHLKETGSAADALAATASSVYAVLSATLESGEREEATVNVTATVPDKLGDEPVARFQLTLSLKRR